MILNIPSNIRTLGVTASAFDLLHPGHLAMLAEAKERCDFLACCLHINPALERPGTKQSPFQTAFERQLQLESCKFVDKVVAYETERDLLNIFKVLKTTNLRVIRFIGEEYYNNSFTGKEWCEQNGIEIYYNPRKHDFSSTQTRTIIKTLQSATI